MAVDKKVNIQIRAKDDASSALKGLSVGLAGVAAAAAAAVAAIAAVVVVMKKATALASVQEDADLKLAFALRSIGENSDASRNSLFAFAGELQNLTGIGDETIESMIGVLTQVGRIGGNDIKRATRATLDLAKAMGIDLNAAAILVAKAAAGDVSALSRYGLKLDESIPPTEKFAALLELLETNFGGSAEAAGKTFSGALAKVTNNFGDMLEKLGDTIVKNKSLRIVLEAVAEGFNALGAAIVDAQPLILKVVDTIVLSTLDLLDAVLAITEALPQTTKRISQIGLIADPVMSNLVFMFNASADSANEFGVVLAEAAGKAREKLEALRVRIEEARGATVDIAAAVGNLASEADLFDPFKLLAPEGFKKVADLGIESFDSLIDKAAAVQAKFVELELSKGQVSAEFFKKVNDELVIMALELNTLSIGVRGFANVSAEEAVRLLETVTEVAEETREQIATLGEDIQLAIAQQGVNSAVRFGDALVDAAFAGQQSFKKFFVQVLQDIIKLIVQMLILKAIAAAIGGPSAALFDPFTGSFAHGGIVGGGRRGSDSVAALLTPGEIVLPTSLRDDFAALSQIADSFRGGIAGGGGGLGATINNTIIAPPDRDREVLELIDDINEAVRRRGFTLVASEVLT